jgi:hypothetical protein
MKTGLPDYLRNMFNDERWRQAAWHLYYRNIDGAKPVGVVLATMSPGFDTFAENQAETERLLARLREGKISAAFVVAVKGSRWPEYEYYGAAKLEEFYATVLAQRTPRAGRNGAFWTIYPYEFEDKDESPL